MSQHKLNTAQFKAITHQDGPLLIVAGAGTGKTTVITEKIKYLTETGVSPDQIVALTFTDKAVGEMIERLDQVMPYGYEEPWIHTFHTFGQRLLKYEGLEIGLNPAFKVMSQPEQWLLMHKHLFELELDYYRPLGNPTKFISALVGVISRLQDEDIGPDEFRVFAAQKISSAKTPEEATEANRLEEVAHVYTHYQQLKANEALLDFGDLISYSLKLFRTRPQILAKYQQKFVHFLVDEFQDTNYAQYQLIKLLCPPEQNRNITVVGDDSQSIYRFRGAAISNILSFMDDYPKATQVILTNNYRSTQQILDGAYSLIRQNDPETLEAKLGISKNLKAISKDHKLPAPEVLEFQTDQNELAFVVNQIIKLINEGYRFQDIAIIARSHAQLDPYSSALKQEAIPFQRVGSKGLFDQEEITHLLNFLQILVNPDDSPVLFKLLSTPPHELSASLLLDSIGKARKTSKSLWQVLQESGIESTHLELINQFREKSLGAPPSKLLLDYLTESNTLSHLTMSETVDNLIKLKNINLFLTYLARLEQSNQEGKLPDILGQLEQMIEAGDNPAQAQIEDIDAVTITTAHSSKGLEFPVVFMVSLVAGRFPSYNRRDPIEIPDELLKERLPAANNTAEERRLFYVGLTRAKRLLYLSFARDYGGVRKRKPSGFLAETNYLWQTNTEQSPARLTQSPKIKQTFVSPEFKLEHTSYSQIDTYKSCPLKFKYRYILRIPAEPNHTLSFGQTIHNTLNDFHQLEMAGHQPNLDTLMSLYQDHFIEAGYLSAEHKQTRKNKGKESLEKYYKEYSKLLGQPKYLERSFSLNIDGVVVRGKIDRIDQLESGGFRVIDYKTGSLQKKSQVDKDPQLSIYALAATESLKLLIEKLGLYFIDDNELVETTRTLTQMNKLKSSLKKDIEAIKTSNFEAKPGIHCRYCEFAKICPSAYKE